ncbi:MAG: hypothetical protein KDB18_13685, partial [Salinibacterium sp.]|nr:hypothetical protein [Salinibacterium sp.]
TGGSMAALTAIVTAREEHLGERFQDGVLFVGNHAHHSVAKAARIAGFRSDQIVVVGSDDAFRMDTRDLAAKVSAARSQGLRPFLVVGNAGCTDVGSVDPLVDIADLCAHEGLWFHADAAYGGFFRLTERGREVLRGLERSDSVTLDPHKGLFLPYGTGALLVRDGESLRRTHASRAHYMPPMQDEDHEWTRLDFCEHGPELSRDYRGLRVWLPLKLHGLAAFRECLDEKLDLIERAAEGLTRIPGVELVSPPKLSILAFRLVRRGMDASATDALNEELLRRILLRQRVWLTSTRLQGCFVIRICVLSFRTHADRVDEAVSIVSEVVAELEGQQTS